VPEIPRYVDFARTSESDKKLRVIRNWPISLENAFDDEATYRFTIKVHSENGNQTTAVDVIWKKDWNSIEARKSPAPEAALSS
jgi:hypothetical protein